MLRNLVICSLLFATIAADGQFSVLNVPKSLAFKGNEPLKSDYIDDVFNAALGHPTTGYAQWSGLLIKDPFGLPSQSVAVYVEGVNDLKLNDAVTNFAVAGSDSSEAVRRYEEDLKATQSSACVLDFTNAEGSEAYASLYGDDGAASISDDYPNLKPESYPCDKQLLQVGAYLRNIAENFPKNQCKHMVIKLSLADVMKTHGEGSKASVESVKLISKSISNINAAAQKSYDAQALVVAIANEATHSRVRRAAATPKAAADDYNLAEYYSEDYPVIFNIILWFMVAFGLSLLAISYAIGSMDPGRDSIIYRMTSTRMKKDN